MSCPLCKSYTNGNIFFHLGRNVYVNNVQNPCYPFLSWRSRLRLMENLTEKMFFNFNVFLNVSKTSTSICLKLKWFIINHKKNMQVKVQSAVLKNSLLTFAKVMPLFKTLNIEIIHSWQYVMSALKLFIDFCQSYAPL